jgi:aminomethyltransferase
VGKTGLDRVRERLIGLRIEGRRSARHGDEVYLDGVKVGTVTSGSIAPSLGCCVALAYVRTDTADADAFTIKGARAVLEAVRVDLPFYTEGTARKKLDATGC